MEADTLFASFFVSLVGAALVVYGKKQSRLPHMVGGVLMTVYPYFVSDVAWIAVIGVALVAALWLAVRAGA